MLQEKLHFHFHKRIQKFLYSEDFKDDPSWGAWFNGYRPRELAKSAKLYGLKRIFEKVKPEIVAKLMSTMFSYAYLIGTDNVLWALDDPDDNSQAYPKYADLIAKDKEMNSKTKPNQDENAAAPASATHK